MCLLSTVRPEFDVTEVPHQSTLRTKARLFRSISLTLKINY
jgi:hypothetical protein